MTTNNNSRPSFLRRASQLIKASIRPVPPSFGDGRSNSEVHPKVLKAGIIKQLESQAKRIPANLQLLIETISMKAQGGYEDDSIYVVLSRFQTIPDVSWNISSSLSPLCRRLPSSRL